MARKPRKISETGYYHVYNRGHNKEKIFLDKEDYKTFTHLLVKYLDKYHDYDIKIVAYSLMPNHFHLLISDQKNIMSNFLRALCSSYATYFNYKYMKLGKLFQGRFKSLPINDDQYMKTVFYYILHNPEKAGIALMEDYPWSSFWELDNERIITHPESIIQILGGVRRTIGFLRTAMEVDVNCIIPESVRSRHLSGENVTKLYQKLVLQENRNQYFENNTKTKKEIKIRIIKGLYDNGATKAQIAKLMFISERTVYEVLRS